MMRSSLWIKVMMLKVRMSKCRELNVRGNGALSVTCSYSLTVERALMARGVKVLCMASNWPPV